MNLYFITSSNHIYDINNAKISLENSRIKILFPAQMGIIYINTESGEMTVSLSSDKYSFERFVDDGGLYTKSTDEATPDLYNLATIEELTLEAERQDTAKKAAADKATADKAAAARKAKAIKYATVIGGVVVAVAVIGGVGYFFGPQIMAGGANALAAIQGSEAYAFATAKGLEAYAVVSNFMMNTVPSLAATGNSQYIQPLLAKIAAIAKAAYAYAEANPQTMAKGAGAIVGTVLIGYGAKKTIESDRFRRATDKAADASLYLAGKAIDGANAVKEKVANIKIIPAGVGF